MKHLRQAFASRQLNDTLKKAKLCLHDDVAQDLGDLGVEIWNTAIKEQLDHRYKLCAYIVLVKHYQANQDMKTNVKIVGLAGRIVHNLIPEESHYVYGLCMDRLEAILKHYTGKEPRQGIIGEILPLMHYKLQTSYENKELSLIHI